MLPDRRCLACRMPLDRAVADRVHPGCRPARPLGDAAYDRLVVHLTQHLGAVEIAPNKKEITA